VDGRSVYNWPNGLLGRMGRAGQLHHGHGRLRATPVVLPAEMRWGEMRGGHSWDTRAYRGRPATGGGRASASVWTANVRNRPNDLLGWDDRKVQRVLARLLKSVMVRRLGAGRATRYELA
jgi:hypothetical protein